MSPVDLDDEASVQAAKDAAKARALAKAQEWMGRYRNDPKAIEALAAIDAEGHTDKAPFVRSENPEINQDQAKFIYERGAKATTLPAPSVPNRVNPDDERFVVSKDYEPSISQKVLTALKATIPNPANPMGLLGSALARRNEKTGKLETPTDHLGKYVADSAGQVFGRDKVVTKEEADKEAAARAMQAHTEATATGVGGTAGLVGVDGSNPTDSSGRAAQIAAAETAAGLGGGGGSSGGGGGGGGAGGAATGPSSRDEALGILSAISQPLDNQIKVLREAALDVSAEQQNLAKFYGDAAAQQEQAAAAVAHNQAVRAQRLAEYEGAFKKAVDDLSASSKVDPNRIWKENPSQAVLGVIGAMMFQFATAGRQPNIMLDQFNRLIDRDIDAQKASFEQGAQAAQGKKSLWQMAFDRTKDENAADLLAKSALTDNIIVRAKGFAAKIDSAKNMEEMEKTIARLEEQKSAYLTQAAQHLLTSKTLNGRGGGGGGGGGGGASGLSVEAAPIDSEEMFTPKDGGPIFMLPKHSANKMRDLSHTSQEANRAATTLASTLPELSGLERMAVAAGKSINPKTDKVLQALGRLEINQKQADGMGANYAGGEKQLERFKMSLGAWSIINNPQSVAQNLRGFVDANNRMLQTTAERDAYGVLNGSPRYVKAGKHGEKGNLMGEVVPMDQYRALKAQMGGESERRQATPGLYKKPGEK